jgi:hypothetical protein
MTNDEHEVRCAPPSADIVSLDGLFDLPVYSKTPCRRCGTDAGILRRSIYNGLIRLTVVCETCGTRRGDALSKRELLELIREKRSEHPTCFAGGGGAAA